MDEHVTKLNKVDPKYKVWNICYRMEKNLKNGNEHKLFSTFVKWFSLQAHEFKKNL
jgi:hypothetical protein